MRAMDGRERSLRALRYLALALLGSAMVLPFGWTLAASLMRPEEIVRLPPPLWSSAPSLHAYWELGAVIALDRAYLNSLLVSTLTTAGVVLTSLTCGFAFAKYDFPGRDMLFGLMLVSTAIPFFVVLLPLFYLVRQLGWLDSYLGLILPAVVNGFAIFLMRQYIRQIPDELLDAARLDGASEPRLLLQLVLPLSAPVIVTIGAFSFVSSWNAFLWPLVVVQSPALHTVPLALNSLRGFSSTIDSLPLRLAGTALSTIPPLLLFLRFQRHFEHAYSIAGLEE